MAQEVPTTWRDPLEGFRRLAFAINQLINGKSNNIGSVTLTASQATTTVSDRRAGVDSVVTFEPTTANAAAEVGAGGMYVSAHGGGSFTITHANNAQADRTFRYVVTG